MQNAAALFERLLWHLGVDYSRASCHPLDIARAEQAGVAFRVAVLHIPIEQISDCLKSAVRMIWCTFGLSGSQLYWF